MSSVKKEIVPLLRDFAKEVETQLDSVLGEWRLRVAMSGWVQRSKATFRSSRRSTCRTA